MGGYGLSHQLTVAQGGSAQINDGALDSFWLYGLMDVNSRATLTGTGSVGSSGELVLNEGAKTSSLTLALDGVLSLQTAVMLVRIIIRLLVWRWMAVRCYLTQPPSPH